MVNFCEARQPSRCVWPLRRFCSGPELPASKACCAHAVLFIFVSAACCVACVSRRRVSSSRCILGSQEASFKHWCACARLYLSCIVELAVPGVPAVLSGCVTALTQASLVS